MSKDTPAIEKCRNATLAMGFGHPHFLLVHTKIRYKETTDVPTLAIDDQGIVYVNPAFPDQITKEELGGGLAHEMLHLCLDHRGREVGDRSNLWVLDGAGNPIKLWNIACDMAINHSLREDKIKLPEWVIYPPTDYRGEMTADAMFEYLKSKMEKQDQDDSQSSKVMVSIPGMEQRKGQKSQGKQDGQGQEAPKMGAGCGLQKGKDQGQGQDGQGTPQDGQSGQDGQDGQSGDTPGDPIDWAQVGAEARAMCKAIGVGSAVERLLTPTPGKIDWRKILRTGFQLASVQSSDRQFQTYTRRNRRSPTEGAQLPGWIGADPKIAIAIDVSGSMDREWVSQIIGEVKRLCSLYPGTTAFLVTHTDRVTWQGWIRKGQDQKVIEATGFSGGTDACDAYKAVDEAGRFDVLVHFTDCELNIWPETTAKKLIVGAFGRGATDPHKVPPDGSIVIPCQKD